MTPQITKLLSRSPVRWFIVGCLTFIIDTSLFLTIFHFTNWAVISNLISGSVATAFNYFSHYHWSFTSDRKHRQSTILYLIFFFIFLVFGTSLIRFLINTGISPFFAKVSTAGCIAPISFFLMKFVTFKRSTNV